VSELRATPRPGPQHFKIASGQNLDGASPELRAKLQKRLKHLHGDGKEKAENEMSPHSFADSPGGACDVEDSMKHATEGAAREEDGISDADSEPIEYAMLSVAPHLSNLSKKETIDIFDKVRHNSDEHTRLKKQLQDNSLVASSMVNDCNAEQTYAMIPAATAKESIIEACKIEDDALNVRGGGHCVEEPEPESRVKDCDSGEAIAGVEESPAETTRFVTRLWVPLFAMAFAVGLAPQDHHQVWRDVAELALQQALPQYEVCQGSCAGMEFPADGASSHAIAGTDPDDLAARLRRSREFAQARSQSLHHLGRNLVVGAVGAVAAAVLLLLACSRTCLLFARVLVPLFFALVIYVMTVFVTSMQSIQWIHGVSFLLVRGALVI